MKRLSLPERARLRIELEIAYRNFGPRLPLLALALAACVLLWAVWVPMQWGRLNLAAERLQRAEVESRRAPGATRMQTPLEAFTEQLLPQENTTAQLRMVFQIAADTGVAISQVDLRRQAEAGGAYSQLQVSMPVRGTYPAIKRLCSGLLQGMPALSIDQLALKRENPASSQVEGQISLSLWQEAAKGGAK